MQAFEPEQFEEEPTHPSITLKLYTCHPRMHVCELKPHITLNSAYTFSSMDVCSCLEQHADYTSMSLATGDGERCGPILYARMRKAPTSHGTCA